MHCFSLAALSRLNATQTKRNPYASRPIAQMPMPPMDSWTTGEVIKFITIADESLAAHAELFEYHVS